MPTTFPASLDAFTNPLPTQFLSAPSHSGQHSDANDAIEAMERVLVGPVFVNAVGQGVPNTTLTAATTALNAVLSTARRVWLPDGRYLTTGELTPQSSSELWLAPNAVIKAADQNWNNQFMIRLTDLTNVTIRGGTIDGNTTASGGSDNNNFGIGIRGSSYVKIEDVNVVRCAATSTAGGNGGDGIYVARSTVTGNVPGNIWLTRVVADGNVRQGMSVVSVAGLRATDCSFINTGSTNPGAGVDLEPNSTADNITDVSFVNCNMSSNNYGFLVVNTGSATISNVKLEGGTVAGNRTGGVQSDQGIVTRGVTARDNLGTGISYTGGTRGLIEACVATSNAGHGINMQARGSRIVNNDCHANLQHGIFLQRRSPGPSGYVVTGNTVTNNGTSAASTFSGIYANGVGAAQAQGHIISHNAVYNSTLLSAVAQQYYNIRLDTDCQFCVVGPNWTFGGSTDNVSVADQDDNIVFTVDSGATPGGQLGMSRGTITFAERTTAGTPAANAARIYAVDDGGKTELASLFATGARQQITQEP